jgi:capsular exopolysaccharide synthesis family protein
MSSASEHSSSDRAAQSSRIFAFIHRYRNLLRKRWWIPALTVVVALGAQGYRLWSTPPHYGSSGEMYVGYRVNTGTGVGNVVEETIGFIGTQLRLMASPTVLSRAAARVHALRPELNPPAEPVKIDPAIIPKSSVFHLTATGLEPEYTRLYLESVMEEFMNYKREMKGDTTEKTLGGIRDELMRLEKELHQGDDELMNFQTSNNVEVLMGISGSASRELEKARHDLREMQNQFDLLSKLNLEQSLELQEKTSGKSDAISPDISNPANLATNLAASGAGYLRLKQTIQLKKREFKELGQTLRPKHPKMVELSDEIAREEGLLEIYRSESTNQLENTRNELRIKIENLQGKIKDLDSEALEVGRKMARYQRIKDNNERNQKLYDLYLASMRSLELNIKADPETVSISEHASLALPIPLGLPRAIFLAFLGGLLLGGGLLFVMDKLDDRPTSFTELQDMFDEAILGQIPAEKPVGREPDVRLIQADDPRHAFVEAYRNLRSSLLYMATEGKRAKTLLVTSAVPSDGKSMTTANLAITLAQSGSSVLLIDGDLRRGHLHKRFGVDATTGFTEVLAQGVDWQKVIRPTVIPTLTLLPRGGLSKNPGELFLRESTHGFLKLVATQYDYVIIDTAPVMAADDVGSLAPHVEGVIFVVRAGQTSGRVAHAALDVLYQRGVNILGLVFNGVESSATEYYYYKYKDYSNYPG